MSMQRYATRQIKASASRSLDATFSLAGNVFGMARSAFSLIAGKEQPGWAIGVDGVAVREINSDPDTVLGLLSRNEVIYACMRERMKVLITPAFLVERKQPDGSYLPDPEHDLCSLIRRPGPNIDTATFWRCLEASWSGLGMVYLEPLYRAGQLAGLNPLNPVWMREDHDPGTGALRFYEYRVPGLNVIRFDRDELMTRRTVGWASIPPLIAALGAADADKLANEYVAGFFAGGGIPSGIIKVRGTWTQERASDFRAAWMARFTAQSRLPALLDENIESYERVGASLNELDNETLRMFIETRICSAMGVPPLIIYSYAGLLKATYSNLQEAWASFWDATALPLLAEWADWINWTLLTQYENPDDVLLANVRVRFDPSGLGPYQEDVAAKVAQYLAGYNAGAIKLNEYRLAQGLPADPGGDVYKSERTVEQPAMLELPARQEVQP